MSGQTGIEWTDATWNPVTGCTKVSPGCDHCYAETFAERFRGVKGHHFEHGFDVTLRPERLDIPFHWRKPRKVFVNSMSDLSVRVMILKRSKSLDLQGVPGEAMCATGVGHRTWELRGGRSRRTGACVGAGR